MSIGNKDNSHSLPARQLFKTIADCLIKSGYSLSKDGKILYYDRISIETPIARYMNMVQLVKILKGELSFSKRSSFSDQTENGYYLDPRLSTVNQETKIGGHKRIEYTKNKMECCRRTRDFYVSCWTKNESESYLMWKAYSSSDSGVMVTSTIEAIITHLDIPDNAFVICGPMNYFLGEIDKNNYNKILFSKSNAYCTESEYRFYYVSDALDFNRIYVNIRPGFIKGIAFTPLFGKSNMIEYANMLMTIIGDDVQGLFLTPTLLESK